MVALYALGAASPLLAQDRCAPPDNLAEAVAEADYVFTARAIAPVELVIPDGSRPADGWSFVATGVAKGQVPPEQLVAVPPADDACAVLFERETDYLVLATDERADLPAAVVYVDTATGTRPLSEAGEIDLTFVEPQPIPVDPDSFPVIEDPLARRASGDVLTARAGLVMALIVSVTAGLAVWLWRTRPRS